MRAFYGVKKLGTWTDKAVLTEGFQNFKLKIPFENRGKYANLHLIDPLHWGRLPIMQILNCPTLAKVNGKRTRGTKASRDHDPADSPRSILTRQTFLCKSVFLREHLFDGQYTEAGSFDISTRRGVKFHTGEVLICGSFGSRYPRRTTSKIRNSDYKLPDKIFLGTW